MSTKFSAKIDQADRMERWKECESLQISLGLWICPSGAPLIWHVILCEIIHSSNTQSQFELVIFVSAKGTAVCTSSINGVMCNLGCKLRQVPGVQIAGSLERKEFYNED